MNTSPSMSSGMVFDRTGISAVIFDYGGTLDTNARHWAHTFVCIVRCMSVRM